METPKSIMILNDDCLFRILSYLTISEVLEMEKMSWRFVGGAELVYRKQRVLDFSKITPTGEAITPLCARDVVQRVGPFVHTLIAARKNFTMTNRVAPKSMLTHCSNLQKIDLHDMDLSDASCVQKLSEIFKTIKEVHLVQCTFTDDIASSLKDATQLEVVNFAENSEITGKCFIGLTGIKELNVAHCKKLQPEFLIKFFDVNQQLRCLNINGCDTLNGTCLRFIARKLLNLDELTIGDFFGAREVSGIDLFPLANLPKLTKLKIDNTHDGDGGKIELFLKQLSRKARDRLEFLEVPRIHENIADVIIGKFKKLKVLILKHAWNYDNSILRCISCVETLEEIHMRECTNIDEDALEGLIRRCKNLRYIDISHTDQISSSLLIEIEPLLAGRTKPLVIVAKSSSFTTEMAEAEESMDSDESYDSDYSKESDELPHILKRNKEHLQLIYE